MPTDVIGQWDTVHPMNYPCAQLEIHYVLLRFATASKFCSYHSGWNSTGEIIGLPKCQWSNPEEYRQIILVEWKHPCAYFMGCPTTTLWLTLIPAWMSNHIHYKVWYEIIHPFPNINSCTVEVWEWMINFIPHFTGHVITYPCWD